MNKVLYAREGARSIMDRTFADFEWQVRVEVDGTEIEVPEVSTSGTPIILVVNIQLTVSDNMCPLKVLWCYNIFAICF